MAFPYPKPPFSFSLSAVLLSNSDPFGRGQLIPPLESQALATPRDSISFFFLRFVGSFSLSNHPFRDSFSHGEIDGRGADLRLTRGRIVSGIAPASLVSDSRFFLPSLTTKVW